MNRILTAAALVGFVALPAAAQDKAQLAASAGLSPVQAQQMTLAEIAAAKFNRDSRGGDRQAAPSAKAPVAVDPARHGQLIAAADLDGKPVQGLTIADLAIAKANAEADGDSRQTAVSMSSRGPITVAPTQLAAAAGLTAIEASGMTLGEIYARAHNRHSAADEQM